MPTREYVIDGNNFSTLEGFYDEVSRVLVPGADWGRNLDALNDILRGGFGTPRDGFVLHWQSSERSREALGYRETIRQLKIRLARCHPSNRMMVRGQLWAARIRQGPTVFDWLVEIIEDHGPSGSQSHDNVRLKLE